MAYNVVVTSEAEADLDRFIKYLVIEKESMQAKFLLAVCVPQTAAARGFEHNVLRKSARRRMRSGGPRLCADRSET